MSRAVGSVGEGEFRRQTLLEEELWADGGSAAQMQRLRLMHYSRFVRVRAAENQRLLYHTEQPSSAISTHTQIS